jgi:putative ABC transport system permease protein
VKLRVIAFRNIRRNSRRSLLSIAAIAVAAMAIVVMFAILEGMKTDLTYNLQTFYSGEIRIRHIDYDRYEQLNPLHLRVENWTEVIRLVESHPRVSLASPRLTSQVAIYEDEETFGAILTGVDPEREDLYMRLSDRITSGGSINAGRATVVPGSGLADELSVKPGDKITLLSTTMRRSTNAITVEVAGIVHLPVDALNKMALFVPLDQARKLTRMDDSVTEILLKLERGARTRDVAAELNRRFAEAGWDTIKATAWQDLATTYSFVEIAGVTYGFVALFFFILASSVIVNTTMMVIFERTREIGTVGAMGMTGGEIVRLFLLEAVYLGLIGAAAGVVLGVGLTIPLSIYGMDFSAAMEGIDFEVSSTFHPVLRFWRTGLVYVYAVGIASLASVIPATRAARIKPAEALRSS